jgi:hypothetical protein
MCKYDFSTRKKVNSFAEFLGDVADAMSTRHTNGQCEIGLVLVKHYEFPCGQYFTVNITRTE